MKAGYVGQLNLWGQDQGARLRVFALWFPVLISRAMTNLTSLVNQLHKERNRLTAQLERLGNALSALTGASNTRRGRAISAAGRARIAAAQRARWAKAKGKVVSI